MLKPREPRMAVFFRRWRLVWCGFVALLGLIALAGLIMRNAVSHRMNRQSSGKGSDRNCSKIFDSHGDGSPRPHGLTGHSLKWFQKRCLTLALELARHPEGILVNPVERGEIGPDLLPRGNSSMRRLGAPIVSPFCPNGVTIRSRRRKLRSRL